MSTLTQEQTQEQTQVPVKEQTPAQQSGYFSFKEFVLLSWHYKWPIIAFTALFGVASVLIALSIPDQYKANVLLSPSDEQKGGGLAALANQFGSLASLAGISLGGKGADKISLALEIFRSKQFLMGFIERHELLVPLIAAKEWDHTTDTLILDDKDYDSQSKKWIRKVSYPKQVIPTYFEAYEAFRKRLSFNRDSKSGTVKVTLEYYSPYIAQQWLTLLVKELNSYMRDQQHRESARSIEYLNKQIENTQVAELRNVFYQLIQEQTKKAMLAEAREEFVFKTIDAAIVPERKSKPMRSVLVILFTAFGGLLSLFGVHAYQALKKNR
ncbi:MAG: LPS O-antigen length regulator [Algicola sp.]|nr:LPS O-antigen length regulator [Algicola sp.]